MVIASKLSLFLPPVIGAFIGWITNYIAIRMLFRPHKPIKIGPFIFQGLIPKRRKDVAANIAKTVEKELISKDDIIKILGQHIDWGKKIDHRLNQITEEKLESWEKLPFWSRINDKVVLPLKQMLHREIVRLLYGVQQDLVEKVDKNLDIHKMIYDRIDNFDLEQLEYVVLQVATKELRYIELIGGVMGFVIGLAQVGIIVVS